MKVLRVLFICFILLFSKLPGFTQIKYGDNRLVFPKEKDLWLYDFNETGFVRTTPTLTKINIADSIAFIAFIKECPHYNYPFNSYYRQYVGLIENGKNLVVIHAFCRKEEDYELDIVYAKDAGKCSFIAEVEVETKSLIRFVFGSSFLPEKPGDKAR